MKLHTSVEGMNSLQVVMSCATDYHYRFRCLPGFINKKYLNKYVFDGSHMPDYRTNEFYLWHQGVALDWSWAPSVRDQLYGLFRMYGVESTFDYLNTIATTSADSFLVYQNLYKKTHSISDLSVLVQNEINILIKDCFSENSNLTIDEIVTGTTYALLKNTSVYIKERPLL